MKTTIKISLIICFLIFQNNYAQKVITEKEIIDDHIYNLHYLNDNLERFKTEVYSDKIMIESYLFDPSTQYSKEVFDGINHIIYDNNHIPKSNNLTIDLTKKLKWINSGYDEIIIKGLILSDFNYNGQAKIYGIKYQREFKYDPVSTYLSSSILGYKAPQYASYVLNNLPPKQNDLIGEFEIKNGNYNGVGYLNFNTINRRFEFEFQEGSLLKFSEVKNGEIINEFDISKEFYKLEGQVYSMPNISLENHSFKRYIEAFERYNGNESGMKRFMYFPLINVSPLTGVFHFSNEEIKKTNIFRLLYYSKSGLILTLMHSGDITIQEEGTWSVNLYGSNNITQNLPKYYFSIKFPHVFEQPEQIEIEKEILINDILSLDTAWNQHSNTYKKFYTYVTSIDDERKYGGDAIGNILLFLNVNKIQYNPRDFSDKTDGNKNELKALINFDRTKIARVDWLKKGLFSENYLVKFFESKFSIPNPNQLADYEYENLKEVKETAISLSEFITIYNKNEQNKLIEFSSIDRKNKINLGLEYLSNLADKQKKLKDEKIAIQKQKNEHERLMRHDQKYKFNFYIQENNRKIDSLEGLNNKTKEIEAEIKKVKKYNKELEKLLRKI